ncbi:MAG: DNA/RNA nuclease SfsA [Chloroflexota bacterium]
MNWEIGLRSEELSWMQREDAHAFSPNDEPDPRFGGALRKAHTVGVELYAYRCRVSLEEVVLGKPLPVSIPDRSRER